MSAGKSKNAKAFKKSDSKKPIEVEVAAEAKLAEDNAVDVGSSGSIMSSLAASAAADVAADGAAAAGSSGGLGSTALILGGVAVAGGVAAAAGGGGGSDAPVAPVYTLTKSASSVNEGSTVIFTLNATNTSRGSTFEYKLTGVSADDVVGGKLTGTATIDSNGQAIIEVALVADRKTETPAETLTLEVAGQTASVPVNDTSVDPTYAITSSTQTVAEGATVQFTLQTTNVDKGATFDYVINGVDARDVVGGTEVEAATASYTVTAEDCVRLNADQIAADLAEQLGGNAAAHWGVVDFGGAATLVVTRTTDPVVDGTQTVQNQLQGMTSTDDSATDVVINATLAEGAENTTMDLTVDGYGDFDIAITGGSDSAYTALDLKLGDSFDHTIETGGFTTYIPAFINMVGSQELPFDTSDAAGFDFELTDGSLIRVAIDGPGGFTGVPNLSSATISIDGGETFAPLPVDLSSSDGSADWSLLFNTLDALLPAGPGLPWFYSMETATVYNGDPELDDTLSASFDSEVFRGGNFGESITVCSPSAPVAQI